MTLIREEDLVESIADAFQYISYFHPPDFVTSLSSAWEREESQSAKDAMAQSWSIREWLQWEDARYARIQVVPTFI